MVDNFIPDYLNIDYNTYVEKLRQELANSDVFRDFDYEGSNISIILEMMAYFGDQNTYFINKIAKNVYMETADVYENVNRLARQVGYEPKGTRGSRGTLTLEVTGCSPGDTIVVQPWKQLRSGRTTPDEGDAILFATTTTTSAICSGSSVTIDVPIRQGEVQEITNYKGTDIIDNDLILPLEYAYDDDLDDTNPSIEVTVNGTIWTRTSDFYDDIIIQEEDTDNVYMFIYDRYQRNIIRFNSARNVPGLEDTIDVIVLESLGVDGNISADTDEDTWSIDDTEFVYNATTAAYIDNDLLTLSLSGATTGGSDPETITQIQTNSQSALRAQFRNVTENDYDSHLSSRSDIVRATAYGEQDIAPSGSVQNYNVVRVSVIPETFGNSTISTSAGIMASWPTSASQGTTTDWGTSATTVVPIAYNSSWETELRNYLRRRKVISHYEVFIVPDLVYFSFEFTCRIFRTYQFVNVATDILNKLDYYFRAANQNFFGEMDFNDVMEYLLDTTIVSTDDEFSNIRGIRNLNLRDINVNKWVYEENNDGNYPYFVGTNLMSQRDNNLRPIQIGPDQFPALARASVQISQEF